MQILALIGSPSRNGRTRRLSDAVVRAAEEAPDVIAETIEFGEYKLPYGVQSARADDLNTGFILDAVEAADAFVIGTPIYRATYSAALKSILDLVPRGLRNGERSRPFQGKPVVVVATAASAHHFLGLNELAEMLRGFFSAYVVPPGLYATHSDFGPNGELVDAEVRRHASVAGRALVAMQLSLGEHKALRNVEPQV